MTERVDRTLLRSFTYATVTHIDSYRQDVRSGRSPVDLWLQSWPWHRATGGRVKAKVLLKWAKLGWSGPEEGQYGPAGGEVSGAAVQWFRLHYIDGLQLLNLPWPSAGSNVGHWGVQDEKKIGEGWATKIYLTKQGWSCFWGCSDGRVFTTTDWGAEIEFGAQPKNMSWGEHKTQSLLDGSDVLTHKQDDGSRRRGRKQRSRYGRGNVQYYVTDW